MISTLIILTFHLNPYQNFLTFYSPPRAKFLLTTIPLWTSPTFWSPFMHSNIHISHISHNFRSRVSIRASLRRGRRTNSVHAKKASFEYEKSSWAWTWNDDTRATKCYEKATWNERKWIEWNAEKVREAGKREFIELRKWEEFIAYAYSQ